MLDQGLRSGLFLSGLRRTGKSTFLRQDLIPALENAGALVVYVDLWSDVSADPSTLIHAALRSALKELQSASGTVLSRLKRIKSLDVGGAGFTFGFEIADLGTANSVTIAQVAQEVIGQAKTDLVFIVDEVQHMLTSDAGIALMQAFKAARDAVNLTPDTPGHFIFIGTGSHRAQVVGMTVQGKNAFEGATSVDYPTLGEDYVEYVLQTLHQEGVKVIPSQPVASHAFGLLGRRPEELVRALRTLQKYQPQEADLYLPVIAATLKEAAADIEIKKIEELGDLACAVFGRVANAEVEASGLFSASALGAYSSMPHGCREAGRLLLPRGLWCPTCCRWPGLSCP
ncbi:AAA family ATPase [Hydrogenophaga sp.]|uniref:AAA family ATPase n=1 Tax=Hydrogenophaga sp. TaxID=1904254 RepID=UPI0025BC82C5|nr:AAA family ATPase [Hydrogenophaga sp.]